MNLMLRFKYKPNDAVNFVVNGERKAARNPPP